MSEATRILIVNDCADERTHCKRLLSDEPDAAFDFFEAGNIKEALAGIRQHSPDCIVVDHDLADVEMITESFYADREKGPAIVMLTCEESGQSDARILPTEDLEYLLKSEATGRALRQSVAVAIEKAGLRHLLKLREGALQRLAAIDDLTGLYSRGYAINHLEEEIYRAQRFGTPFCIALIGLDDFKGINEKHGDVVTDLILRTIGHFFSHGTRFLDLVSRYENEKFLIVLPNTRLKHARLLSKRIRGRIKALKFLGRKGTTFHITCSTGLTEYEPDVHNKDVMIRRAEFALYEAKQQGGDLVNIWQGDSARTGKSDL